MKKIAALILIIGIAVNVVNSQSTRSISYGVLAHSLTDDNTGGAVNGTAFALPQRAIAGITWCHDATVDPSAISISLQHSNDNSSWSNQSTSTTAAGTCTSTSSSARFVRCALASITGGTNIDCNINVLPSNISIGSISFPAHNTYDIGSTAVAARNINLAGLLALISAGGNSVLRGQGSGIIEIMNSGATGFTRLSLGPIVDDSSAITASVANNLGQGIIINRGDGTNATFATLSAATTNGSMIYCSDCTIANPCASGGTGAIAKRLNGAWVCN